MLARSLEEVIAVFQDRFPFGFIPSYHREMESRIFTIEHPF